MKTEKDDVLSVLAAKQRHVATIVPTGPLTKVALMAIASVLQDLVEEVKVIPAAKRKGWRQ